MSGSEVTRGASAEVAPVCVGAAKLAGVLASGALVDVCASSASLLVVEAGWAEAAEASQRVVARRSPADLAVQALVLIWVTGSGGEVNKGSFQFKDLNNTGAVHRNCCKYLDIRKMVQPTGA